MQTDPTYQQMQKWTKPNGVSDRQTEYVDQVVKDWRTQQQDLSKQLQAKQLTREEYNAAIQELRADTRSTLQRYLGADNYERMKKATGQMP